MNPLILNLLQSAVNQIQLGELELAKQKLKEVLQLDNHQSDAIRFLGVIAGLEKDWEEALNCFDRALQITPLNGVIYSNLGNIFIELERYEDALSCYEKAIQLEPAYAEAYNNKGNALQALKSYKKALSCYEKAIQLEPAYAEAYNNKGNALQALERYEDALSCYEKAIQLEPKHAFAFLGAARVFNTRKQYNYSIGCSERALAINPRFVEACLEKGYAFFQVKNYPKAIQAYDQALKIDTACTKALMSKAEIYFEMKQFKDAQHAFKLAYDINPLIKYAFGLYAQTTLQMCEWDTEDLIREELIRGIKQKEQIAMPYNLISLFDDPLLIKEAISIYATDLLGSISRVIPPQKSQRKKIRLGYFSADFHNHPTAYLIAELFEIHDKSQFELIGFVFGRNQPDEMRSRLVKAFDQFIDVEHLTDSEIASKSREMEIDIAIDLKGFTKEGRPKIFMHGAAPIQISYLAFPGTMALPCFDYIVADRTLVPESARDGITEKIIYMPNSYQVNDRARAIAHSIKSREELGLPKEAFVYCCFNNNYKITPAVFDGWVRILDSVEGSILWLFADNPLAVENLKKEAGLRNLDPNRLIFAGRMDSADHLARYRMADLFLDTTPCNAHTTASDALWAGLPVLTLIGKSFGARVASSLLKAVGLPDLIATSQDQYEMMAIDLATHPEKLHEIKVRLSENLPTSSLFDTLQFTKSLEDGYKKVYGRYQEGLGPSDIFLN